MIYKTYK